MTKELINRSLPVVLSEIEQVLEQYPEHPHQQAFANPDLRQELVAYVLNHVQSVYVAVEVSEVPSDEAELGPASSDRCAIHTFIHQGIHEISQQHPSLSHQIPENNDAHLTASHWFG